MYHSRRLFFVFVLVQLFWNRVAANRALSHIAKKVHIRPMGCDVCLGPDKLTPHKPYPYEEPYLGLHPCEDVKTSWTFRVADGTHPNQNMVNIVNNANGECVHVSGLYGMDGFALYPGIEDDITLEQTECEVGDPLDTTLTGFRKTMRFTVTLVEDQGWRIQQPETKLYLIKGRKSTGHRGFLKFCKDPGQFYWDLAPK